MITSANEGRLCLSVVLFSLGRITQEAQQLLEWPPVAKQSVVGPIDCAEILLVKYSCWEGQSFCGGSGPPS